MADEISDLRLLTQLVAASQLDRSFKTLEQLAACGKSQAGRHGNRWRFQYDGAIREIQVDGRLSTTSSEVLYQWALEGFGMGIKALWDIEEDLATGRLVECLAPFACDNIDLFMVYASRPLLPLRMRVLSDYLIKHLGDGQ